MVEPKARAPIAYAELGHYLRVLGVPNRLELLRRLQIPRTVTEIDLTPSRRARDREPTRQLSRNAVEQHLRRLQELGLVLARGRAGAERGVVEYVVNHARLFVVTDELRRVSLERSPLAAQTNAAEGDEDEPDGAPLPDGPALVVANGPREGVAFALDGGGPWLVGRGPESAVSIPYDPFVSRESARVRRVDDAFEVEALAEARNGARLNWRRLEPGKPARLVPGDFVGVGRSLLVFRRGVRP